MQDPKPALVIRARQRQGVRRMGAAARSSRPLRLAAEVVALAAAVVLGCLSRIRLGADCVPGSQAAASTGIFKISPMKIITSSPESMYYAPVYPPVAHSIRVWTWESTRPRRMGRDQQGRLRAIRRPVEAALVERVVDPGQRPPGRVVADRIELPVSAAEAGAAPEAEDRQLRQAEEVLQVVVGAVLPAGRPDQFEVGEQPLQPDAGLERDAVRHPVDELKGAGGVLGRAGEAEEADHAIDVDGEHGTSLFPWAASPAR